MRTLFGCALLAVVACAPAAPSGTASSGPAGIIATGDGGYVNIASDNRAASFRVPAAPQPIWKVLPDIYREIGIPEGTIDQSSWTYGNQRFTLSRRLGSVSLSEFFRCGSTATGEPIATTYRLRASVLTRLQPVSDSETEVATAVQATATSNAGTSTDPVACSSTGVLESRIASEIRARVGS